MYTIHADGQLLFDSLSEDVKSIVLSPKLSLDVNKAGSVAFVLPPGNSLHGKINKLKGIVTVEQDGAQIFRSRAMETETDIYNQERIYCEGEKAFLLDSVHAPYSYSGTVQGLFRKLIANHNSMVDAVKQFTVGEITAVNASETMEVETDVYSDTASEVENRLLNVYGGYLRTRTANGVHYIDWVEQYGNANAQPIEFSVNLLDLNAKADAGEVFTCLIPLGASELDENGEYTDPVSIASVNNGLNYLQDDDAVAKYGKIWRTYTWSYEDDPAKLLEKAREYMKTGIALETLSIKAVDMHFVNGDVQPIRIGDRVRILSNPHGLDKVMICAQMEIDLCDPENTVYTFGERPRTLTENFVKAEEEVETLTGRGGGGGRSVKEEVTNIRRWADILADEERAIISLLAGEEFKDIDSGKVLSLKEANLILNGAEGKAGLIARVEENETKISSAELILNGDEATAGLIAKVEENGERISSAELILNGDEATAGLIARMGTAESSITAKVDKDSLISEINMCADNVTIDANKVNLSGYVTASLFETEIAAINNIFAGYSQAQNLHVNGSISAQNAQFTNVSLINYDCEWKSKTVQTSIPGFTTANVTLANGNTIKVVTGWADAPSNYRSTMYYLSHD